MLYRFNDLLKLAVLVWIAILVSACGQEDTGDSKHLPEVIHSEDACHVCGMYITQFPGPKAQAFVNQHQHSFKFCSTQEMFSWLLQPESAAIVEDVYVHDMGSTEWDSPGDEAFVDATQAWYVAGHNRKGAMGPTLASFARLEDAEAFVHKHGGEILAFDSVDMEVLLKAQSQR